MRGRGLLVEDGNASYVRSAFVTGRFFEVLGVEPVLGRALRAEDDVDGAETVTVISRGFWQRRYGASPLVLGRRVEVEQQRSPLSASCRTWTFLKVSSCGARRIRRRRLARLAMPRAARSTWSGGFEPGVTLEQARSELATMTAELERSAPPGNTRGLVPVVLPLATAIVGDVQPAIVALMMAVGLVLLIASANVANLVLLRGESRASGAGRAGRPGCVARRIVAHVLTESVVLTLTAGIAGVAFAWWTLACAGRQPARGPPARRRHQHRRRRHRDGDPRHRPRRRRSQVSFQHGCWRTVMSPGHSAAAAAARSAGPGAGCAARSSLFRCRSRSPSSPPRACWYGPSCTCSRSKSDMPPTLSFSWNCRCRTSKYGPRARHEQFLQQATTELGTVPGIPAATPVNNAPFSHSWDVPRFTAEGQTAERAAGNPALNLESIFPNYFATLQIGIVRGRAFDDGDREGAQLVAIVSDDVAERMWPGGTAIGKRLKMGGPDPREPWLTVVGVARSTRYRTLDTAYPTLYLPAAQFQMTAEMLVLRVTAPFDQVAASARARIAAIDKDVRVVQIVPFARLLDRPLARPRFQASLSSAFGLTAFMLAAVGLYAVIAASVRQRSRELALRVAIGANAADLRRLVLGEAIRLAGTGAIAGLLFAALAGRWVSGLLAGVSPLDPPTLAGAAVLLMAAAVAAAYVPMRRAARVDVGVLLRE